MRRLAVALGVLAGPALADCASEFQLLMASAGASAFQLTSGQLMDDEARCRLVDVVLSGGRVAVTVEDVFWTATGIETSNAATPEPITVDLEVRNLRVQPQSGDPWVDYLLAEQARRQVTNATFDAEWNPASGLFVVCELAIDLPGESAFRLAYRVRGLSPALMAGQVAHMADMEIEELYLEIESHGFFDSLIMGLVSGLYRPEASPQETLERFKRELVAAIGVFPDAVFPGASRQALQDLVAAGPFPWGRLEVTLAGGPVAMDRFLEQGLARDPLAPDVLARVFEGAVFDIRFDPVTEPR